MCLDILVHIQVLIASSWNATLGMQTTLGINCLCTMLLEQIKEFYHGITKIFLLVGSYTMLSWHS